MRPSAVGRKGAETDRKIVGGNDSSSDSDRVLQDPPAPLPLRLRGPVPDTLADLDAACEARRAALTGAYNAPDVQADRLAIAAEAAAGGAA